jgi:hypothetical protein
MQPDAAYSPVAVADNPHRWVKGQSGNPNGRPKLPFDIKTLAKARSRKAFEKICALIDSPDERVALAAAKEVMDRAWGRAAAVDHDDEKRSVTINIVKYGDHIASASLDTPTVSVRTLELPGEGWQESGGGQPSAVG